MSEISENEKHARKLDEGIAHGSSGATTDEDMEIIAALRAGAAALRRLDKDDRPKLRDQFAMAAVSGLLSVFGNPRYDAKATPDQLAVDAFTIADAMLRAREASDE